MGAIHLNLGGATGGPGGHGQDRNDERFGKSDRDSMRRDELYVRWFSRIIKRWLNF